jgi:type II secretory pathway pseudopilin PulG
MIKKDRGLTRRSTTEGYSLIEMLFYISLVSILTIAVVSSLVVMTKAFRETSIQGDFVESASMMERISREVRQAYGINSIGASDLKLNTKDEVGTNKTVRFVLSSSNVQLYENDVLTGNLNTSVVQVTALSFIQITTPVGTGVKIILSVRSTRDPGARVEDFYSTVVLRGDYAN